MNINSSCCQNEFNNNGEETKSRRKRDLSEKQVVLKKTPEEELREKLSEDEKINLEFLKEALGDDGKFDQFLSLDEGKVKSTLAHIKTQLESCKNNNNGKNGFKAVVQGYFKTMDEVH
ncbi:Mlp family lipoprotein (plasmid) [Borrelia miyamotoi]|nr:Mlp family lipoprotein [Borrelia miyamotoi]QBK63775.1 Mlp family lipoprotein [Borrelia miyamotoi]QBK65032.1 Mlp family lipoprotein [Borrelia miyamotoi]QBK66333.1 Mlp family lipoprotein [Borrelia miyamotoi]QBL99240.1 Mlp family lipoprotein [Borrelia miyamotoi]